jgi:hypothetical protein
MHRVVQPARKNAQRRDPFGLLASWPAHSREKNGVKFKNTRKFDRNFIDST